MEGKNWIPAFAGMTPWLDVVGGVGGGILDKDFYVYLLASKMGGTLYVGVTSDLVGRTYIHREDLVDGFTRRYGVHRLVGCERHGSPDSAILREKQLKKWNRAWKIRLIEEQNPRWEDLYLGLFG